MKFTKTWLYTACLVLAASFLAACADMQTGGSSSSYSDYGSHSGHSGHH